MTIFISVFLSARDGLHEQLFNEAVSIAGALCRLG